MAVMLQDAPIGEVILKNMDEANRSCVMSNHLQNDRVKNLATEHRRKCLHCSTHFMK